MSSRLFRLLSRPVRLPAFLGPAAQPDDPQIFGFNAERGPIISDVVRRVVGQYSRDTKRLLYVLNEAGNAEVRRLASQGDMEASDALGFWRRLVRKLGKMDDEEKVEALRKIVRDMGEDIAGNFDPRVYALATRVIPGLLTAIMSPSSLPQQLMAGFSQLDTLITVEGPVDKLRRLAKVGTLVLVPTHSSNLDSVALGYVLMRERPAAGGLRRGQEPVLEPADQLLHAQPRGVPGRPEDPGAALQGRAQDVLVHDDRARVPLAVLPGRDALALGAGRAALKLGLAGTAVEAFARNQARGLSRPVYFVPATLNYALVLEAETLIEDHLKGAGQAATSSRTTSRRRSSGSTRS
jgi:glycerol-3-phosphate O-acyltransferase